MSSAADQTGERLAEQSRWLQLLLLHLANPRVLTRIEVDDLVQEVFLRAVGANSLPAAEEGAAALRRFLGRLARNTVIDVVRALRRAKRSGPEARITRSDWSVGGVAQSALVAATAGPATRAVAAEDHRARLAAFEKLSAEHRRVIGLRQLEGLSAAATAARMGRSESAVHSLYRRALQAWADAV